ncbi:MULTISPECIES: sulfotransferase [unclassified Janthinobacterium]|uniref:sulfotransferase family protein n=1 Tax=unclassified Janthinobacterium TaxID=2610881 RepID=UPI0018C91F40|nr:sulfotransferase [Janthinobacterium sp. CG_23.4]MDH6158455.1 sulfotransferase [Janthinobacterium sp. CG_23.4]
MTSRFVGVAGLPRAGSTLLCQLLAEHPEMHSEGHSSPLCNALLATRHSISDDQFFLSQLDAQADITYAHLKSAMQGFLSGWHAGHGKPVVVDKNRAWLHCIEFLLHLDPSAKLLVPIRELGQIYGSIEAQHQKTILIDFIDHLADLDRFGRADQLFAKDKAIGAPLSSIEAVQDLPQAIKSRLYFVKFEDLMAQPAQTMAAVYAWLGVAPHRIDPAKLVVRAHESDSHYRNKYLHRQHAQVVPPGPHTIPPRIQEHIEHACAWYYAWFYPKR